MTTKIPAELSSTPGIADSSNATAITITSAEKVGINEDAPQQTLSVGVTSGSLSGISLTLNDTDLGAFLANSSTGEVRIGGVYTNYFPTFYSNNSEAMRINSTGDFLVRQTDANVYDTNTGGTVRQYWGNQFSAQNNTNSKIIIGSGSAIGLIGGATTNSASKFIVNSYMVFGQATATAGSEEGYIDFYTSTGGAAGTQKMRIYGSGTIYMNGNVRAGTALAGNGVIDLNGASGSYVIDYINSGGSRRFVVNADTGNVQNTNNSYGSLSDSKIKENIVDATNKLEDLNKVKVRNFNIKGEEQKQIGVIAQELESIFPNMIEDHKDYDEEGEDLGTVTKSVKYSVFVPMLIKALQEADDKIEALTARIETLEG